MNTAQSLLLNGVSTDDAKCMVVQWARDNEFRYPLPSLRDRPRIPGKKKERGMRRRRSVHKSHWRQRNGRQGKKIQDFLRGLRSDGFVFYDEIIDPVSVRRAWEAAEESLRQAPGGKTRVQHVAEPVGLHRKIDRLVCHEALRQLAREYLGTSALFETMRLEHLDGGSLTHEEHPGTMWHREEHGRKLTAVVFLDDGSDNGRGVDVVQGTQDLHFYTDESRPAPTLHAHCLLLTHRPVHPYRCCPPSLPPSLWFPRYYEDNAVREAFPDNIITLYGQIDTLFSLCSTMPPVMLMPWRLDRSSGIGSPLGRQHLAP